MSKKGENIYKRKDGRWEARYIKGCSTEGKTVYQFQNFGNERGAFLEPCRKFFSPCPLLTFLPSSGRSRERPKIKSLEKIFIPSLGRQRKRRKINPPRKIFCFGSDLKLLSGCGTKIDAMSIPDFIGVAAKLMPQNKRPPLFRSRRSFLLFSFYRSSRISSSLISSVGLPPATSLFRKDNRPLSAAVARRCRVPTLDFFYT